MRRVINGGPTPQQKNISVQNKFGNPGIKHQQGATKTIWHWLPLDGRTTFEFFKGVGSVSFPFTNLEQNKLDVGDSLTAERYYLAIVDVDPNTGIVNSVFVATDFDFVSTGQISLTIANSQTMKPISIMSSKDFFNKSAEFPGHANFEFDTQQVLPPLLAFQFNVDTTPYAPINDSFLALVVEGAGSQLAPRATF